MHASCLVIVPAGHDAESTVEKLMAPHDENLEIERYTEDGETYWRNPDGFWDWYRIGGRWDGHFLGLERLDDTGDPERDDAIHYSDAVTTLERNSAPASQAGEWNTYTVLSVNGWRHRKMHNPDWDPASGDYSNYMIEDPGFAQWRAEQLMAYRDGIVVVVDYHS